MGQDERWGWRWTYAYEGNSRMWGWVRALRAVETRDVSTVESPQGTLRARRAQQLSTVSTGACVRLERGEDGQCAGNAVAGVIDGRGPDLYTSPALVRADCERTLGCSVGCSLAEFAAYSQALSVCGGRARSEGT